MVVHKRMNPQHTLQTRDVTHVHIQDVLRSVVTKSKPGKPWWTRAAAAAGALATAVASTGLSTDINSKSIDSKQSAINKPNEIIDDGRNPRRLYSDRLKSQYRERPERLRTTLSLLRTEEHRLMSKILEEDIFSPEYKKLNVEYTKFLRSSYDILFNEKSKVPSSSHVDFETFYKQNLEVLRSAWSSSEERLESATDKLLNGLDALNTQYDASLSSSDDETVMWEGLNHDFSRWVMFVLIQVFALKSVALVKTRRRECNSLIELVDNGGLDAHLDVVGANNRLRTARADLLRSPTSPAPAFAFTRYDNGTGWNDPSPVTRNQWRNYAYYLLVCSTINNMLDEAIKIQNKLNECTKLQILFIRPSLIRKTAKLSKLVEQRLHDLQGQRNVAIQGYSDRMTPDDSHEDAVDEPTARKSVFQEFEEEAYEYMWRNFSKQKLILIAACLGIPFYRSYDKYDIASNIVSHRSDLFTERLWPAVKGLFKMMKSANNYNFYVIQVILAPNSKADVVFWSMLFGNESRYLYEPEWEEMRREAVELISRHHDKMKEQRFEDDMADFERRGVDLLKNTHLRYYKS